MPVSPSPSGRIWCIYLRLGGEMQTTISRPCAFLSGFGQVFMLLCKADKLFFGLILERAESLPGFGTPHHEGTVIDSFKGVFHFLLSLCFFLFFLWQNKFQLFPNESFPVFCLLRLMTKERVCWQKPALSKHDKVLAVCLYHRSKQCQEPKI